MRAKISDYIRVFANLAGLFLKISMYTRNCPIYPRKTKFIRETHNNASKKRTAQIQLGQSLYERSECIMHGYWDYIIDTSFVIILIVGSIGAYFYARRRRSKPSG